MIHLAVKPPFIVSALLMYVTSQDMTNNIQLLWFAFTVFIHKSKTLNFFPSDYTNISRKHNTFYIIEVHSIIIKIKLTHHIL